MTLQTILNLLFRHALTAIGGGAVVDGILAGDTTNQLAGVITGIVTGAVGVGMSVLEKKNR